MFAETLRCRYARDDTRVLSREASIQSIREIFDGAAHDHLLLIVAVHASPAAVLFRPSLVQTLYGVPANGPSGLLLIHRGALFLGIVVVAAFAAFNSEARRAATLLVGISVIGFPAVYSAAGTPVGPLRLIALVDVVALVPLAFVIYSAWRTA